MKRTIIVFLFLAVIYFSHGQGTQNLIIQNQSFNSLKDGVGNYDYIYKTAPETPGVNGSPYLFDTWSEAVMHLKEQDNEYHVKAIKYDILANKFEFNYAPEIKVLNGSRVERFEIVNNVSGKNESYLNCAEVIKGEKLTGFCRLLVEGDVDLIIRKKAIMMNPTYNSTLMVGNKDKEIIIEDEYYLSTAEMSKQIKDKGDIKNFFKTLNFDLGEYKKISAKDTDKVIELVNHYNQSKSK